MSTAKPNAGGSPPRVSVILIFLDAEPFLGEAIDSVLAQTFHDFELLLVDDGSTDGGTARARDYAERHPDRVRYLEHPGHANRGVSAARNLGLRFADGEYVAFIDADDVWNPRKLQEQVAIMDGHPELAMVCGTVRYWHGWTGGNDALIPTGHVQDRVVPPPEASLALYPLGTAAAPCPSDLLLRCDVVRGLGGFEDQFTGMYEDQAFLAKLYIAAPVYFSSRAWLNYRQHPDSCLAGSLREGSYHEYRRKFLEWFERYLNEAGSADPRVRQALRRALRPYRGRRLHALRRAPGRLRARARRVALAARRVIETPERNHVHGVAELARRAAQAKDWPLAEGRWRAVLEHRPKHAEALGGLAQALLQQGRLDDAESAFARLAEVHPGRPIGFAGLARCAVRAGDQALAEQRWRAVLANWPKHFGALDGLAQALVHQGRIAEAEAAYVRLSEAHPDKPGGYVALARCAQRAGDQPVAERRWRAVLERWPRHLGALDGLAEALLQQSRIDAAEAVFARSAELYPDKPKGHFGLARCAGRAEDWLLAEQRWAEAAARFPGQAVARIEHGSALLKLHRADRAEAAFKEATAAFPDEAEGFIGLARVAMSRQRFAEAAAALVDAAKRFPDHAGLTMAMGDCLIAQRRFDDAEALFQRFAAAHPDDLRGHAGLAQVAEARGDWFAALRRWQAARERFPDQPWPRLMIGKMHEGLHRHAEAAREYRSVAESDRAAFEGWKHLASLAEAGRDYELAAERWEKVRSFCRELASARLALARCRIGLGRLEEARDMLHEAASRFPYRTDVLQALGQLAARQEQWREAVRWQIRAVRIDPFDPRLWSGLVAALADAGRVSRAHAIASRIATEFPGSPVGHLALSRVLFQTKRFRPAMDALDAAVARSPARREYAWLLAPLLLFLGEAERRRELLLQSAAPSTFPEARARELPELNRLAEEASSGNGAAEGVGLTRYRNVLCRRHEMLVRPLGLISLNAGAELGEFFRRLDQLVETGDAAGTVAWIDQHGDAVKHVSRQQPIMANVLCLKARALQELGRPVDAFWTLREAVAYAIPDNCLYHEYLGSFRSLAPRVRVGNADRVIVLIMTCERYLGRARLLGADIERHLPIRALLVTGDPSASFFALDDGQLVVPCGDGYDDLPRKIAMACEYLAVNSGCQGVLKLDDDVFVYDSSLLARSIREMAARSLDYVGRVERFRDATYHFGSRGNDPESYELAQHGPSDYCVGGSYFLSRRSLQAIARISVTYPSYVRKGRYEDVAVGEMLAARDIRPHNKPLDLCAGLRWESYVRI